MVEVVTAGNRQRFADALENMHRDRKTVFVDQLGWNVPVRDGLYEIDQYDTEDAVYLIVPDESGRGHLGSVRLLPSTRPHLLAEVFPELCAEGVPTGEEVWEITRLCTRPGLENARPVRQQIMLAITEFALMHGVRRYTCVTHVPYLSRLLAVGWDCEPLGLPIQHGPGFIGAMVINITPETLKLLQNRAGIDQPVLHLQDKIAA